tara:strand:- start:87 stop:287 length:201 start_codon:yes stop_codon:yes gene_type:complete
MDSLPDKYKEKKDKKSSRDVMDLHCFQVEHKFFKCMKNSGDDLKECANLMSNWNKCLENYYNHNNK